MVTGATTGIGYYTALELAKMGAEVIIVSRDPERCREAVNRIKEESKNDGVKFIAADLSSQAQIHQVARQFNANHDHLDVLVNNAGGFFLHRELSTDHIEMTFALNHLAYFLLTILLIDALKAGHYSRIINVSSGSHLHQKLDFSNLQMSRFYNPMKAYGRSKLANILFTYECSRRLVGTQITANALTPGMVNTEMWKKVDRRLNFLIDPFIQRIGQTPQTGARTSIYLATSPDMVGISGKYYANLQAINSDPYTYDRDAARRLWEFSCRMVGLDRENVGECL
jgi:NAD(P)-dependent dehydrogenase (short-subunit alcohol dehydrogenase family)